MSEQTFYDIHMHAFNLSHPYFGAFIKRFNIRLILAFTPIIAPIVTALITVVTHIPILRSLLSSKITNKVNQILNLLSVMENDVGSFFLLLENCLRENGMLDNQGLHVGGDIYSKCILTPLMIDFGYKGIKDPAIHYKEPSRKPIREQVIDVFNAINYYSDFVYEEKFFPAFPHLRPDNLGQPTSRVFEIYPFIGINTKNYEKEEIEELLKKYFSEYEGRRADLARNIGKFDGDIDNLRSNFVAGVKVYPPLDFDPWPEDDKEKDKVICLYEYCEVRGIPITVHGSTGGFVVVKGEKLKEITKISKWETVLSKFPKLKLNIAHFPVNEKFLGIIPKRKRLRAILNLVLERENVYVDFSCRAIDYKYYKSLLKLMDSLPEDSRNKLANRILFGSDFAVSLTSVDSYNSYLSTFSLDSSLTEVDKKKFCYENPEKFLFLGVS